MQFVGVVLAAFAHGDDGFGLGGEGDLYAEPAALFDEVAGVVFFVNHDGDARRGVVKRAQP